jgi:hypothetical protein
MNWRLLDGGYAIEWLDIDEHIGVDGLLAGRQRGESVESLRHWLIPRQVSVRLWAPSEPLFQPCDELLF